MTRHKIIKLLTITGALLTAGANAQEHGAPKSSIGVFAVTEQDSTPQNYIGVSLQPNLKWEGYGCTVGYYGSFYREGNDPGTDSDWSTSASKVQVENNTWTLEIGRSNTRQYAGHLCTPTTSSFDNTGAAKGTTRTHTGAILTHKSTGLSLGQVAENGNLKPCHCNHTLVGWTKKLSEQWAIQLQATADENGLDKTGATIKWHPTDTTTVVAEGFYSPKERTCLLTTNHKLGDNLTLFAGTQMTAAAHEESCGLATAGASYNLGGGFTVLAAGQQTLGAEHETTALVGIKYSGNFR